ncbi:hypothetical protein [Streptomyces spongiicola]|nr:hypothetical protein [Streptomyces spongiicola]
MTIHEIHDTARRTPASAGTGRPGIECSGGTKDVGWNAVPGPVRMI